MGANDSGKTSLLEAIFLSLAPSNPESLVKTQIFRHFFLKTDNVDSIFYNFNQNTPIKIITQDNNISLELQIEASLGQNEQINLSKQKIGIDSSLNHLIDRLIFKSKVKDQPEILSSVDFLRNIQGAQELQTSIPSNHFFKNGLFFPVEYFISLNDLAMNIDNIRRNKATERFIEYLKIFNSHIVDIEVNSTSVYVNLENKPKLLDIHLMGTGFKKYVTILAAIFESFIRKGNMNCLYVCVDEIENGLYFKNCEKLLESLITLGKEMNIQYFFSTHSLEFLEILRKVSEKMNFKEQAIFQIKETKRGIKVYQYNQNKGELETLLLDTARNDKPCECFKCYIECLGDLKDNVFKKSAMFAYREATGAEKKIKGRNQEREKIEILQTEFERIFDFESCALRPLKQFIANYCKE